jgi:hypothetical protein
MSTTRETSTWINVNNNTLHAPHNQMVHGPAAVRSAITLRVAEPRATLVQLALTAPAKMQVLLDIYMKLCECNSPTS